MFGMNKKPASKTRERRDLPDVSILYFFFYFQ